MGCAIYIGNGINWKIKKKMKGRVWIEQLSQEEKVNFLNNLMNFRGNGSENFLDGEYGDFYSLIASAFPWEDSHEGFDYWFHVSGRYIVKYKMDKFKFV